MTTIKTVSTRRYEVSLEQLDSGMYCVAYEVSGDEAPTFMHPTNDLKLATLMFDKKLMELEGN